MNKVSRLQVVLHGLSALAMVVFIFLFLSHNAPGFTGFPVIGFLGVAYAALFLLANPGLLGGHYRLLPPSLSRVLYALTAIGLPLLFLNAVVWDYYQPLSLFDDAIAALAVSWSLLVLACLIALVQGQRQFGLAAAVALAGIVFMVLIHVITNPAPLKGLSLHADLFDGGEGGYKTYRIPAMLVIPAGSTLADGSKLDGDRIIAMAEARRDGDLDTGVIDLVQRVSDDGGESWSDSRVICTNEREGRRGKCGNATPVFDAHSGTLFLAYNLSGLPRTLGGAGRRGHSAQLMASTDGGMNWAEPVQLPFDGLVFGPGHGVQKTLTPAAGRLVLPGNREGSAQVIFSDDQGVTWHAGTPLGAGNENEIAELSDGRLYMAVRHNAPIGRPPEPNGRLFSVSSDGGASWSKPELDTRLITPVCQASVLRFNDQGGLLFANPADDKTRVRMTIRSSSDNGASWPKKLLIYPGPAGYSQLARLSNGDALLLYERGRVEYSERISFVRMAASRPLLNP